MHIMDVSPILTPIRKTLILQQAPHPPSTPITTRNIPSPIRAHARPLTTLDIAGIPSKAFSAEAMKSDPTTTRDPAAISASPMSWKRVEMSVDSKKILRVHRIERHPFFYLNDKMTNIAQEFNNAQYI